jgi:Na+/H+-dicarboxylate symporter
MKLPTKIFIALIVGIVAGYLVGVDSPIPGEAIVKKLPFIEHTLKLGGDIFLRLITMVIIPLVVFSLICGMASIGDIRKLGRIGIKTICYFISTTIFACLIGLVLVNLIKPGEYISKEKKEELVSAYKESTEQFTKAIEIHKPDVWSFIRELFPRNPLKAMVEMDMLKVILFALMFGLAVTLIQSNLKTTAISVISSLNEVMIKMVDIVMYFAPIGVFCLIGMVTATTGLSILGALGAYCLTVLTALIMQLIFTYGAILRIFTPLRLQAPQRYRSICGASIKILMCQMTLQVLSCHWVPPSIWMALR